MNEDAEDVGRTYECHRLQKSRTLEGVLPLGEPNQRNEHDEAREKIGGKIDKGKRKLALHSRSSLTHDR